MSTDTQALAPHTGFSCARLSIRTDGARRFVDLTDEIGQRVTDSGMSSGLAVITSMHTTASLVINEHEPELLKDLDGFLDRLAPRERAYAHNDVPAGPGEQPNGHSHCQALLLHVSITLPVVEGRLAIGRYQRIFLVELDCSRPREIAVSLLGA